MTKKYGILAHPVKHSLSPVMHNAAFKALEVDAQYGVFDIREADVQEFMDQVRHEPISGLSVSLPYKENLIEFLNVVDADVKRIGAVNTVLNKGGSLYGFNTDWIGSNKALEAVCDLNDKTAVVIGAGGAARAICYGLLKAGANVVVMNRTVSKAQAIAVQFAEIFDSEIHSAGLDELHTGDILINATSLWVSDEDGGELPDFCQDFYVQNFDIVMDVFYKPLMTPLLDCASRLGKVVVTGDKMLLWQAVEQFNIWTGLEAPVEVMRETLERGLG